MQDLRPLPFPESRESEMALLGGLLTNPSMLDEVVQHVGADDFQRPEHGKLFALLQLMAAAKEPIDTITVPERLARENRAQEFGGVPYVIELVNQVSSTANLSHYAQVIREKATLRRFIETQQALVARAFAHPESVPNLLEDATNEVMRLQKTQTRASWERISSIIDRSIRYIEELEKNPTPTVGIETGFSSLDKRLGGFHPEELIILAARPSMGKTALMLNFARNAAMLSRKPVAIFSMEMSRQSLVDRMLSAEACVHGEHLKKGTLDRSEWDRVLEASERLRRAANVHIDDTPALTLSEIRIRTRRLESTEGQLGLIMLDYLQLMGTDNRGASRTEQVSEMSRGMKALAKDLKVPVIALSQLNRSVETRADKRPLLSDLRESGAIEQDADVIMFIYRDEYYNKDSPDRGLAEVITAKHRNGEVGTDKLACRLQFQRFDDVESDPEKDY